MNIVALQRRVEQVVEPIIAERGLELIDVEIQPGAGRWVLRIAVDYPAGGVTLEDCARISRAIEGVLDVEGEIPAAYRLEVSSPGLDRVLKRLRDFERVIGRIVELQTQTPIDGRAHYKGKLLTVDAQQVVMEIDRNRFTIPIGQVAWARLRFFDKG